MAGIRRKGTNVNGVTDAMKRTALTREQIYYVEAKGHLGVVAKTGRGREYTAAQIEKLERIAACRRMGLRLSEAGAIASAELSGSPAQVERLRLLAAAKAAEIEREISALVYILTVLFELVESAEGPRAA
jgi:DNA-binding transcriptional MerR regulator